MRSFTSTLLLGLTLAISLSAKSIWVDGRSGSLFSDPRASGIGDLITVLVDESTSLTSSQQTSREKSSNIANEVKQFLFSPIASKFGTKKGVAQD